MIKNYSSIFLLLIAFTSIAQTNLYQHKDFDALTADHKIIAVVPFEATVELRPKQRAKISDEEFSTLELKEGAAIQGAMYSWFLKRKKRGTMEVDVQSPRITNSKLAAANITASNMYEYTPEEIAKILKVDSIIMGTFNTNKPMSEGAAVVLGLLVGFFGSTNSAVINMEIYNAADGELLWNYNKKVRGSIGSDSDDLINTLMRKASRRLGYTD
jgi:hypothetical protein